METTDALIAMFVFVIVFMVGFFGAAFGFFMGGIRYRRRLVTGLWARILGSMFMLLSIPPMVLVGMQFLPHQPESYDRLLNWLFPAGDDRPPGMYVTIGWAVCLMCVSLLSLVVPDENRRKEKPPLVDL